MDIYEMLKDLGIDKTNIEYYLENKMRIELGEIITEIERGCIDFYHNGIVPDIGEKKKSTEVYKHLDISPNKVSYLQKYFKLFSYFDYDENYKNFTNGLPVEVAVLCGSPSYENDQERIKNLLIKKKKGEIKTYKELSLLVKGRDFNLKEAINLMLDIDKNIRKYSNQQEAELVEVIIELENQLKEVRSRKGIASKKKNKLSNVNLPGHIGNTNVLDVANEEIQNPKTDNLLNSLRISKYDDKDDLEDQLESPRNWRNKEEAHNFLEVEEGYGTEVTNKNRVVGKMETEVVKVGKNKKR